MLAAATTPPRFVTLVLLTGLSVLSLNMFLPSLPNMAASFEVDYGLVALSIAGYLGVTAVLQLIIGPLSDRYGRRPVLLAGLTVFVAASLGCLLADSIWLFLGFRVLQGAVIAGSVLSLAVIRDTASPQEAASRIGYVTMAMAVAPMLGPMLGGGLDTLFGWRASFIVYAVFGVLALALCWFDLGETNASPSETFGQQIRAYPDLLRARRFWGYAVCMAVSVGAFYTFLAGSPLVAGTLFGLSTASLGVYLGSITAGFAFGSFLSGRLSKRYALTTMMIAGRLVAAAGLTTGLLLFLAGIQTPLSLFGSTIFVGLGNGLTMPSCNAGVLSVRPKLAGSAAGLAGAMTVGGGALLTSLTGLVVTEASGAYGLFGLLLLCVFVSLAAALYVRRIDRQVGAAACAPDAPRDRVD